jgi:multicomponent Na+:H+ antiporter subunit A
MGTVLLLGAVGYGVAVLFVLHGAPDLALTQLLIETLSLAMFVMVLRHLPDRWEVVRWKAGQTSRIVISAAVALLMGGLALWAGASRVAPSISDAYVDLAEPEGGGGNVVNVILTDFRGFDTMGEITVIALAAVGCVVLLGRARRRPHAVEKETS